MKKKNRKDRKDMFAKNDEEKRSRLWKTVMTVSTVLIIIIAAFFVIKLFTSNPLEGTWIHEDSGLILTIQGEDTVSIEWPEEFDGAKVKVPMECSVNKDMKILTLSTQESDIQKAAKDVGESVSQSDIQAAAESLQGNYDYSIEQKQLILTEREYGEQLIFQKR